METMFKSDGLCMDILYLKNYLLKLYNNINLTEEFKKQITTITNTANKYYMQYQCFSYINKKKAIRDLLKIREMVLKLNLIRKSKNLELRKQYDDLVFYITETKTLYYSGFVS